MSELTVDRFGHGPSSLLRMDHYPAAGIRIDASFVHGLARRRDDTVVVRTIAQLGADLGLELSADGNTFAFGDAPDLGSIKRSGLKTPPVVGLAAS